MLPPEENPRPQPGRSAGEPPPAACSPTALGVVPGGGSDSQFGWDEKVVLPHIFCQVVFRSAWFEPTCHSLDPPR